MQAHTIGPVLLREVDHLSRERFIDREAVFQSLEQAFQKAFAEKYGLGAGLRVSIHRKDGSINAFRCRTVVEEIEDYETQISLSDPEIQKAGLQLGQDYTQNLPLPDLSRTTVQNLKGTLVKSIQDLERAVQYEEYKDRLGQIISGTVRRVEGGNVIVDLGRAEGIVPRSELIPRENFRPSDRIKAYVYSVQRETKGFQIFLSRTHPGFLAKLFAQEVPEVYDGLIEIKAVARDPGSRAKVAIFSKEGSKERSFDPVGSCVGVRGSRVNSISQELQGEKIDVILWSPELATFVVNALTPAEVVKVILEGDSRNTVTVVVADDQQSIAIGRKGQNVRLAYQLTGVPLEIVMESTETAKRTQEREEKMALFMEKLSLDELMAHFLFVEGFRSLEELALISVEELMELDGFNAEIAQELKNRAIEAHEEELQELRNSFLEKGGSKDISSMNFPEKVLSSLTKHGILTKKDLADLSLEELSDIVKGDSEGLSADQCRDMIMQAREQEGIYDRR
jgi:transcription termination/antitermination protein NusA